MNLATFIDPPIRGGRLGQAEESVDMAVWAAYLTNLRDNMVVSWNEARDAYLTHKRVREIFGLPHVVPGGEGSDPNALTESENQIYLELAAANEYLARIMDEALAGQRNIVYVAEQQDFAIEVLDTDTIVAEKRGGNVILVDRSSRQPVPVSGTIGIAPIIWGIGAGVVVAAMAAWYFAVDSNNQLAKVKEEEKTKRDLVQQQAKMVQGGATPAEAKKMVDAVLLGSAELKRAAAEEEQAKKGAGEGIQDTIKTAMWVGLGIGALYFLARVIPAATAAAEQKVEERKRLPPGPEPALAM